jgi:tetratricopeptide (TPR) repeat protein/CHAT domain-containing protein
MQRYFFFNRITSLGLINLVVCLTCVLSNASAQNLDQALLESIETNDLEQVSEWLKKGANPNARDENGATALMWAIYTADLQVAKKLVSHSADPKLKGVIYLDSTRQSYYGNLTGIAAAEGDLEKLKYLFEELKIPISDREWNPETNKEDGWTAIQWAWSKNSEAIIGYLRQNGASLANDYKRQVLETQEKYGSKSLEFRNTVFELAEILNGYENAPLKATESYAIALAITGEIKGTEDPDYLFILEKLCDALIESKANEEAEKSLIKLVSLTKAIHGNGSALYLEMLGKLASFYLELSQHEKAKPVYMQMLEFAKKDMGEKSMEYAGCLEIIALTYRRMGDYETAERLLRKELEIEMKLVGNQHEQYAITLNNLGMIKQERGEYADALVFYQDAMRIKDDLKTYDEGYAMTLDNLSSVMSMQGMHSQAIPLQQKALELRRELLGTESVEYAMSLNNLGFTYSLVGQFKKAESMVFEASQTVRRHLNAHPNDFTTRSYYMSCIGNLAIINRDLGNHDKARDYFEEARLLNLNAYGENHPNFGGFLASLASFYQQIGNYKLALQHGKRAEDILLNSLGEQHLGYIESVGVLAYVNLAVSNFSEAETLFNKAVRLSKEALGPKHSLHAFYLNGLALVYQQTGRFSEAEKVMLKSLDIRTSADLVDHPNLASSLNNLGMLYLEMGNTSKALSTLNEALDILRSELGPEHPMYAATINNKGMCHLALYEYENAETCYREALRVNEICYGQTHTNVAHSLNNLGTLYLEQDRAQEALIMLDSALQIQKLNFGDSDRFIATLKTNLALTYKKFGDMDNAIDSYGQAIEIFRNSVGSNYSGLINPLTGLARVLRMQRDTKQASGLFHQALELLFQKLADGFLFLSDKEKQLFIDQEGHMFDESMSLQLDLARDNPLIGIESYNTMVSTKGMVISSGIHMREAITNGFDSQQLDLYNRWMVVNSSLAKLVEVSKTPEIYLVGIGVQCKVEDDTLLINPLAGTPAYLAGLLQGDRILSIDSKSISGEGLELDEMIAPLRGEEGSIVKLGVLRQGEDIVRSVEIERQLVDTRSDRTKLEDEAEELEKQLTRMSSTFAEGQQLGKLKWTDVQSTLNENDVAVEFGSFQYYPANGNRSDSTIYVALVLRKGYEHPVMVKLCEEKQLDSLFQKGDHDRELIADLYRGAVAIGDNGGPSYGKRLYELLWQPLDSLLNEGDNIYFAPSGLLHRIALSAIPYGDTEKLLSDRYQLNRLSTTAKLVTDRDQKETRPKDIVLFGGIDYELKPKAHESKKEDEVYVSRTLPLDIDRGNTSWSYLPGTLKETESIATIAGKEKLNVRTYTGADATEEQIKALGGKASPTVLHIASHGFFFPDPERDLEQDRMMQMMGDREQIYRYSDDPLNRAGLLFSGANHTWQDGEVSEGMEDGILTANEATYIPLLNTELVVLSACETGLGEIKGSEGVFGLQRAFKAAGAEYVMMSLWKVPDQETSEFMESFYGEYLSDHTIPESYHHAQKVMREKYPDDPYKWAGFVLMR